MVDISLVCNILMNAEDPKSLVNDATHIISYKTYVHRLQW